MTLFDWLSLGIGLISGKDAITQEDLNEFDRAECAISIIPIIGNLSKLSKAHKAAKHAKKFKILANLVEKANKANDAVDKINIIRQIIDDSTLTCGDPDPDYDNNNEDLKSIDEISD